MPPSNHPTSRLSLALHSVLPSRRSILSAASAHSLSPRALALVMSDSASLPIPTLISLLSLPHNFPLQHWLPTSLSPPSPWALSFPLVLESQRDYKARLGDEGEQKFLDASPPQNEGEGDSGGRVKEPAPRVDAPASLTAPNPTPPQGPRIHWIPPRKPARYAPRAPWHLRPWHAPLGPARWHLDGLKPEPEGARACPFLGPPRRP